MLTRSGLLVMVWCSRCGQQLRPLPGAFSEHMQQFEGTACSGCARIVCDSCNPPSSQGGTLTCTRCAGSLDPVFARDLEGIHAKHMKAILAWCDRFREHPISVQIGNRSATTTSSSREESPGGPLFFDLIADGRLQEREQDADRPGVFGFEFDSHVGGTQAGDRFSVGYEVSGVDEDGERLVVHKGNQVLRLVAHASGAGPSPAEAAPTRVTPARPSVASLVERGDVPGLIDRLYHPERSAPEDYAPDTAPGLRTLLESLDQKIGPYGKARNEASAGLRALGERAVPSLVDELGTKDGEVGACVSLTLSGIGSPALPALVEAIRSGPEDGVIPAGVTIGEIQKGGVQLPPDLVRTLVTIKMSPPVGFSLTRQQAAAHALGPLDAQSIPDWVGLLEKATLSASARPAKPVPATQKTEHCKRCGGPVKSGDYTCPQCGNSRWGAIVVWAIASLVCLGAAVLWAPRIAGEWGTVVLWGGWIVGLLCLLVAVNGAVTGLRTPRRPLPESVPAGVTDAAPGSAAGAVPSAAGRPPTQQAPATAVRAGAVSQPDPLEQEARAWIAEKERAMVCDRCNAPITPPSGVVITPDVFRLIVRQGFGPSPEAVMHAVMKGVTEEQFTRGWRNDLVERSTTPWLLCPSCALQGKAFMPGGLGR